jgi:hypothetical protein
MSLSQVLVDTIFSAFPDDVPDLSIESNGLVVSEIRCVAVGYGMESVPLGREYRMGYGGIVVCDFCVHSPSRGENAGITG